MKANIPLKYKDRILEGWTIDGGDAPRVLEKIEKDHCTLADAYEKPSKFLMDQGKIRLKQSERGKNSAQRKRDRKKD